MEVEITNKELYERAANHDKADIKRFGKVDEKFGEVHKRLDDLPKEIKTELNGSVQRTVKAELNKFLLWFGTGGLIILVGIGVAWGTLTNQVSTNTQVLSESLDRKDLDNLQIQLNQQASAVQLIQDDVKFIRDKWQ